MKQKQHILHSLTIEVMAVATGFNDCISSMQYAWHTNEFTAICYGYRIYSS